MSEQFNRFLAAQVSDAELAELVADARAAALAALRAQLTQALVAELLGRLQAPSDHRPPAAGDPPPADGDPPATDDLALQLAALRAQLDANNAWLGGSVASPQQAMPSAPAAVVDLPSPVGAAEPQEALPSEPDALVGHPSSAVPPDAGLYLYAVRRRGAEPVGEILGVAGEPLAVLPCGALEAVVGQVPLEEFGEAAMEQNLRDHAWLEQAARAHQAALTALLPGGALVPLRFATIFSGPEPLAALLAERAEELLAALSQIDGREEWGVRLTVDEATLAANLAEASPAVRALRDELAAKPAGAAYMLQKRFDRLAAEEARRVSDRCADDAHARLCAASVADQRGPLREGSGPTSLLNGAYLVAHEAQTAFADAFAQLRAELAPLGFQLELTGPWPPYSFAAQPARVEAQEHAHV